MDILLVPGNEGQDCPGNPELCDECDFLICCTNYNGLCDQCFIENGVCPKNYLDFPRGICYT